MTDNEYTRAGSAYKVIEQYKKNQKNESGEIPVFIKLEPSVKKVKSIN
jgi:hypothetical protein